MLKVIVDTNYLAVQIMWLFLLMRITSISENIWMMIELLGCVFCTGYAIRNIRYIKKYITLWVVLFACSYLISSVINRPYNGPYVTFTGIKYAWKMILCFAVPWISIKKKGSKQIAKVSWNCLLIYWIPSVVTVLLQGRNVVDNANNTYFIGNKFNMAYLNVIMLCLYLYFTKIQDRHRLERGALKIRWKKMAVSLFYIIIIYLDLFMKAYTGLFMVIFVLLLNLFSNAFKFKWDSRWTGFYKFISSPVVIVASVLLSGIVTFSLGVIMNIPTIATYLKTIGKTGNILSRTLIYKNLIEIISKKTWTGYGYGSAIVSRYFGPNAQNGLAQVAIQAGIIGILLLMIVTFRCVKVGRDSGEGAAPFLFGIYAFILSATVEITFGGFFFVLLAFYCACGWEKIMEEEI